MALLNPILWTPEYAVNIPLIDEQHKVLFQIMDNLRLAILEHREKADVAEVMRGLVDYCLHHFHDEEAVMKAVNYPSDKAHAAVHSQFQQRCLAWADDFWQDKLQPIAMLEFLEKWLVTHILHNDKKLAAYMEIQNIDMEAFVDPTLPVRRTSSLSLIGRFRWRAVAAWHTLLLFLQSHFALLCLSLGYLCTIAVLLTVVIPECRQLSRPVRAAVVGGLTVVVGTINLFLWWKIRVLSHSEQESKMLVTRQVSDALLASQIAERIATIDLDMEILFTNADQQSPLLTALKSIVDNLLIIRPHIPSAVFALIRGENDDDSDDDKEPTISFRNNPATQSRGRLLRASVPGLASESGTPLSSSGKKTVRQR